MKKSLTIKQEMFCQAFIRLSDKSAAYREAYNCSKMKPETINRSSFSLFNNHKVTARIEELQNIAKNVSESIFKHTITDSLRLDFELINRYKKHLEILENPLSTTKQVNTAKRAMAYIKVQGFNAAMDRVSKKLGFYEKNNEQKIPTSNIDISDEASRERRIQELILKAKGSLNIKPQK